MDVAEHRFMRPIVNRRIDGFTGFAASESLLAAGVPVNAPVAGQQDIQIPLAGFPVSVDDDIAFILEIERSLVFSPFA